MAAIVAVHISIFYLNFKGFLRGLAHFQGREKESGKGIRGLGEKGFETAREESAFSLFADSSLDLIYAKLY